MTLSRTVEVHEARRGRSGADGGGDCHRRGSSGAVATPTLGPVHTVGQSRSLHYSGISVAFDGTNHLVVWMASPDGAPTPTSVAPGLLGTARSSMRRAYGSPRPRVRSTARTSASTAPTSSWRGERRGGAEPGRSHPCERAGCGARRTGARPRTRRGSGGGHRIRREHRGLGCEHRRSRTSRPYGGAAGSVREERSSTRGPGSSSIARTTTVEPTAGSQSRTSRRTGRTPWSSLAGSIWTP